MSEQVSAPYQPEKSHDTVMQLLDSLRTRDFESCLRPRPYQLFKGTLDAYMQVQPKDEVGNFLIQCYVAETPDQLHSPETIKWVAQQYTYSHRGLVPVIEPTEWFMNTHAYLDITKVPHVALIPSLTISWSDINWDKLANLHRTDS